MCSPIRVLSMFAASAVLAIPAGSVAIAQAPDAASARPTITVTDFDYGTVAGQIAADRKTRRQLERVGVRDGAAFAEALGVGAADLVVEKLLETGAFRVLERKRLTAVEQERRIDGDIASANTRGRVARARYIVSGSVTRLGFEEKQLGGVVGRLTAFAVYGLGAKKNLTEVHLTARVIDTQTGDVVASFTGKGISSKGWGLTALAAGGWWLGGLSGGSHNIRESAIGEATERAAQNVVERIVQTHVGWQ